MTTEIIEKNGQKCALLHSVELVITDIDTALDFIATVQYNTGCNRIALNKEAFTPDFFVLSTRLAGEVLQKFVQYHVKLAIYGDFSVYTSKPLKDFIYESNKGNDIFFVENSDTATQKLLLAK